jgi:hypothetical protein
MKPYAPPTNIGRTRAVDDIHHRTADQPRADAKKAAKAVRHAARQAGKQEAQVVEADSPGE